MNIPDSVHDALDEAIMNNREHSITYQELQRRLSENSHLLEAPCIAKLPELIRERDDIIVEMEAIDQDCIIKSLIPDIYKQN